MLALLCLVAYALFFLAVGALYRYFLQFGIWQRVIASLRLYNPAALDRVEARGVASGAAGEALADALDFGF